MLVRNVGIRGKHKLADRWEHKPYIVKDKPNPDIPVYVVCSLSVLIFHLFELVAPAAVVVVVVPVESDSYSDFDFVSLFVSVCFASFYLLLFVFLECLISS